MAVNTTELHDTVIKIIQMPIDQWDKAAEMLRGIGDMDYQHAESMLSHLSVFAGELAVYLGHRGAFGCGDHGHQQAQDAATKRRKALRKANGYSYP